jgi:general secretion pathway protein E
MNHSNSKPQHPASLALSVLNAALVEVRRNREATPEGGIQDLWQGLLTRLDVQETTLTDALLEYHGVAVLNENQWSRMQLPSGMNQFQHSTHYLVVHVDEICYLLSPDPWQPVAIAALTQSNKSDTQLALAKAEQWAQIQSLVQTTNQVNSARVLNDVDSTNGLVTPLDPVDPTYVVQFVDNAIVQAYLDGASDIHFESNRLGLGIKYRLDGVMALGPRLDDPQKAEEVVSRIKVMAQLDITERRRPQDGRIHWSRQGQHAIDLRVSVMPSIFGEDVVLRLLDKAQLQQSNTQGLVAGLTLHALGFDATVAGVLRELAARPHGMLLITGPTGSGKTTTVYAAMSEINDGLEKIVTIEDPVEYELNGVLQIPVNEQKGLTFATGLRSILRHDPDKILVGEIRDAETAQIAVQSSLTGHLVFTTVHANSVFDVLGRFQHFGIESFALASALNGIVVQRLMRKLCPHCHAWRSPTVTEVQKLKHLELPIPERLPVAVGCIQCRHTGYKGRFVVAEVHVLTDPMRDLIVRKASMSELRTAMYGKTNQRLLEGAMTHVALANTSLEEVVRVVGLV